MDDVLRRHYEGRIPALVGMESSFFVRLIGVPVRHSWARRAWGQMRAFWHGRPSNEEAEAMEHLERNLALHRRYRVRLAGRGDGEG